MATPEELLENIKNEEQKKYKGKLKIFLGMCAGVGKTYAMLQEAHQLLNSSKNILVGLVETHGRIETEKLLEGLNILPKSKIIYKGVSFEEFDVDRAIKIKPEYVILDELAHTNIPGSKHTKRYLDVIELLENGINVMTTLNIQHVESRKEIVEQITGVIIQETVPDSIIEMADYIELIDIPIDEILFRLQEGKVYIPEKAKIASSNFFREGNLISLREMALRLTADKVDSDLIDYKREQRIKEIWKSNDKLLVAVGPSPFSSELVRIGRRLSYILKIKWYAVYINTGSTLNKNDEDQLDKNLRLAKELGAEVITTADTNLVDGLLKVARNFNVSQIVIGKPQKYNLFNYLKRNNFIDDLINRSEEINITLVRPNSNKELKKVKTRIKSWNIQKKELMFSILSVFSISALCFPFSNFIGYQSVGLLFLLNLLLMSFYTGRTSIIINSILTSVLWNFFFIPPLFTFNIHRIEDVLTLILNFSLAITTGFLVSKIKRQQVLVQLREKYTLALFNFTKELSNCKSKNDAILTSMMHIQKNTNYNATYFDHMANPVISSDYLYNFNDKEIAIVKWVLENNRIAGKFTDNLPNTIGQFFPIISLKTKIGVLCLLNDKKLLVEDENLINNIIEILIAFCEKEDAETKVKSLELEVETNKLYNTLLDSISHEFRTPIAVISGSATSLKDSKIINNTALIDSLANEIYIASKRLDNLVENLLDISRLETGKITLNKEFYYLSDIISDVLYQLKNESIGHNIIVNLDDFNPSLYIDYGFISQSIFNIIHNALIYNSNGTQISIVSKRVENYMVLTITDNGIGIAPEYSFKIFEKFYRVPGSKTGGTGLGLSISKGFVEAHGGFLQYKNNTPNGSIFDLGLPYE